MVQSGYIQDPLSHVGFQKKKDVSGLEWQVILHYPGHV